MKTYNKKEKEKKIKWGLLQYKGPVKSSKSRGDKQPYNS